MYLYESEIQFPVDVTKGRILEQVAHGVRRHMADDDEPIRVVISESTKNQYKCEVATFSWSPRKLDQPVTNPVLAFKKRNIENTKTFNAVLLVPTGIGAEIGGHAGDATPVATLMSSLCDTLITHPNVLNGSDLIDIRDNTLYVEGSAVCRLLMGTIGLQAGKIQPGIGGGRLSSRSVFCGSRDQRSQRSPLLLRVVLSRNHGDGPSPRYAVTVHDVWACVG